MFIIVLLILYSLFIYLLVDHHIFFYIKFHNSLTKKEKKEHKVFLRKDIKKFNKYKFFFKCLFLLPIRAIWYILILFWDYILLKLNTLIFINQIKDFESELPNLYLKINGIIINYSAKLYFFLCGIKFDYEVIKTNKTTPIKEREKAKAYVSNHTSFLDTQFFFSFNPNPSMTVIHHAKKRLFYGFFSDITQNIYVNRGESGKNTHNKSEVYNKLKQRVEYLKEGKNFNPILVFPEGTITNDKYILPFKKGIFTTGLPVRMFIFDYKYNDIIPEFTLFDEIGFFMIVFSNFRNYIKVYEVDYLLYPDDYTDEEGNIDSEKMAEDCRKIIADLGGLKMYNFKDNYSGIKNYLNLQKKRFIELKKTN